MSKLMHGTLPFSVPANTPFPAWPFDARGKPIPRQGPRSQPTVTVQLSWALGAVSSFLTPFAGWVANQRRLIARPKSPIGASLRDLAPCQIPALPALSPRTSLAVTDGCR